MLLIMSSRQSTGIQLRKNLFRMINQSSRIFSGLRVIKDWQYEVPVWDNGQYALYFTAWCVIY